MAEVDLRKEFFLEGNDTGCLLIHGFSSTPAEVRELGERLSAEGYTVLGVRLAGHGTTVEDMEKSTCINWMESVEEGYKRLKKYCSKVYVIGHSMGSLLALHIAQTYTVNKLVLLSPAIVTGNKASRLVPVLKFFIRYKEWEHVLRPEEETKYLLGYNRIPLSSIHELSKLQRRVKRKLELVDKPLLTIISLKDKTVDVKGIDILEKRVASRNFKKVFLENCRHNITVECEKETVFKEVIQFLVSN